MVLMPQDVDIRGSSNGVVRILSGGEMRRVRCMLVACCRDELGSMALARASCVGSGLFIGNCDQCASPWNPWGVFGAICWGVRAVVVSTHGGHGRCVGHIALVPRQVIARSVGLM